MSRWAREADWRQPRKNRIAYSVGNEPPQHAMDRGKRVSSRPFAWSSRRPQIRRKTPECHIHLRLDERDDRGPGGCAMTEELPRVLFVTPCAFNKVTGGGITFSNLFSGWPKDRLATIHCDPIPLSTDVCEQYYRLGRAELRKWGPLDPLSRAAAPIAKRSPGDARGARLLSGTLKGAKDLVFGDRTPETAALSEDLAAWTARFDAEVLYTILGSNGLMDLTELIRRRFGLPLVVHMMDDWPSTNYRGGFLSGFQRARMRRNLRHLLSSARVRMAICEQMSDAYTERYGLPFVSFQNAIEVNRWRAVAKTDFSLCDPVVVVYAGSLLPFAQLDGIIECCQAIAELNEGGYHIRFDIVTPRPMADRYRRDLEIHPSIGIYDAISEDEPFFRRLAEADILFLPANFSARSQRYLRYSMPTKVPSYLVSGTPILVYGPGQVAQVDYARSARWGHVVHARGISRIKEALISLMNDEDLRRRLSAAASATVETNHDSAVVRPAFQESLRRAAFANPSDSRLFGVRQSLDDATVVDI